MLMALIVGHELERESLCGLLRGFLLFPLGLGDRLFGLGVDFDHGGGLNAEDTREPFEDNFDFIIEAEADAEHKDGVLKGEDDFEGGEDLRHAQLRAGVVRDYIHEEAARDPDEVAERPFETLAEAESAVVADLRLPQSLNDASEGDLPSVQLHELYALNDLTRRLDASILIDVDSLDNGTIEF